MLWQSDPRLGRVMALATVKTKVKDLAEPVVFGERRFTSGCAIGFHGLAPLRTGVELQPLVEQMHAFPDPKSWSVHLRRALVLLDERDTALLKKRLAPLLEPFAATWTPISGQPGQSLGHAARRQLSPV